MDDNPDVITSLRNRFPLVFIDEAQDNQQEQSELLHRIFINGKDPIVCQRFGDHNQAIYEDNLDSSDSTVDTFPNTAIKVDLPCSHRYGQAIADIADPLGVYPQGLQGRGPQTCLADGQPCGKHTIILFDNHTIGRVLDAYAEVILATFNDQELTKGSFIAVGQIHKMSVK